MKTRKINSYMKIVFYMLLGAAIGAVLGAGSYIFLNGYGTGFEGIAGQLYGWLQASILPILVVLLVFSVAAGEFSCRKMKKIMVQLADAEDEESDRLEYEEEKWGALSMNLNVISQTFCMIVLSAGYSSNYLSSSEAARGSFLYACVVFIICMAYDSFWQIRYVKLIQLGHPEKLGDPSSINFQKKWLESCDEAEREVIYRSSYKAYMMLGRLMPILLVLTMLANLLFNTGMLAVIVVAVIWLVVTLTYTHSCVSLKGEKALMK
ncbi:MAG TPA: DUF3169 family protein [Candidatus Merdisoma merdipullorum]|nr:DUF3169 family protein [Candidatus Merdisoma merdipullorum]